jgi:hypothetical protein
MTPSDATSRIRQRSVQLRKLVSGTLVCLLGLLVLERFGAVSLRIWKEGFDDSMRRRLAFQLVRTCPELFYLLALWGIREALASLARGQLYTIAVTRMLRRVGVMLAVGAFLNVFVVPGVAWLLGHGPGYLIAYDVSGLVLGAIGLSLTILARVLEFAGQIQSELEEIF